MQSPLERSREDPVFLSQPTPTLLLDRDLRIKAASRSYLAMTARAAEELVEESVFDAFPRNADPEGDYSPRFLRSVEEVLRRRRSQQLAGIRHDVERQDAGGCFAERRWSLVNSPVLVDDAAVGVLVRVEDLSWVPKDLEQAVRTCADTAPETAQDPPDRDAALRALLEVLRAHTNMAEEVEHLRRALANRPGIDLAKGIVMADRGCNPEEAFEILRQMSMHANVRVVDVAAAIVYHAQHPARRHLDSA
ncbi:MAG: ANTAR domain-containing protein [Nocardioidaceae bacterium]